MRRLTAEGPTAKFTLWLLAGLLPHGLLDWDLQLTHKLLTAVRPWFFVTWVSPTWRFASSKMYRQGGQQTKPNSTKEVSPWWPKQRCHPYTSAIVCCRHVPRSSTHSRAWVLRVRNQNHLNLLTHTISWTLTCSSELEHHHCCGSSFITAASQCHLTWPIFP